MAMETGPSEDVFPIKSSLLECTLVLGCFREGTTSVFKTPGDFSSWMSKLGI